MTVTTFNRAFDCAIGGYPAGEGPVADHTETQKILSRNREIRKSQTRVLPAEGRMDKVLQKVKWVPMKSCFWEQLPTSVFKFGTGIAFACVDCGRCWSIRFLAPPPGAKNSVFVEITHNSEHQRQERTHIRGFIREMQSVFGDDCCGHCGSVRVRTTPAKKKTAK